MASLYLPAPTRSGNKIGRGRPAAGVGDAAGGGAIVPAGKAGPASGANGGGATGKGGGGKPIPSYPARCDAALRFSRLGPEERKLPSNKGMMFVPRSTADFGDGGSFPEIHVAQYPRHMGNPHLARRGGAGAGGGGGAGDVAEKNWSNPQGGRAIVTKDVLSATVDETGKVSYDAIVTQGTNADKKVYTKHSDLRGCRPTEEEVALPTAEEEADAAEKTKRALAGLLSAKVAADKPTGSAITAAIDSATAHERTQFIRYTPHKDAPGYNPQASQRVIRMVPKQVDPMQPPKHMHRKAPRGPAEDPVPVLHAPPEKLTKEEREAWNVPACISNWKNSRGYTIPLDKRLAADGRGLRDDASINSNFAVLSESLYVAERQAREEVRTRAAVQKRLVMDRRERREEELRDLASKARMERGGMGAQVATQAAAQAAPSGAPAGAVSDSNGGAEKEGAEQRRGASRVPDDRYDDESVESMTREADAGERGTSDEERARAQRDRLRAERRREREKEYRLERAGIHADDDKADEELGKKRRLESDRDVSEKIALGTHTGTGAAGGAGGVDSRLYSQNAGLSSGFGAEDEYNAYSRPMFDREGVASSSIYRPSRDVGNEDADAQYDRLKRGATNKFVADKGFGGAEGEKGVAGGAARTQPVQFEKGN
ncbi:hypothetical protein ACHAWF_002167 [Thalassiosira exigua]